METYIGSGVTAEWAKDTDMFPGTFLLQLPDTEVRIYLNPATLAALLEWYLEGPESVEE